MMKAEAVEGSTLTKNLPKGWRWAQLADVCEINTRRPELNRSDDALTTFIPMAAVDDVTHIVAQPEQKPFADVQRGYTYFAEGDILFAKITPCMQNGKHAIARNLIDGIGFGSTEFHVLHPLGEVIAEWLHYFLIQPAILADAANHFTGSVGQQRVPASYLSGLHIPLPPIAEQQRIVTILNEQMATVQQAKTTTEAQLDAAKALPSASLRRIFESPEAQKWSVSYVSQLCDRINYGYTASADFKVHEPRFLRITDIQDGGVDWEQVPGCQISLDAETSYTLADGDIVFARTGGTTGKSFLIKSPPRSVFASYLIRLRPRSSSIIPEFLYHFFQSDSYWQQIKASVRGGAQPNVNAVLLGNIKLPLPPISTQMEVVANLNKQMMIMEDARKALEEQLRFINELPAMLLQRAFYGAL